MDYEPQYAEYMVQPMDEFYPPEETLDHQQTELSLKQVTKFESITIVILIIFDFQLQTDTYKLDYEEQYATFRPQQFEEYNHAEETLDYEATKLSLKQVNQIFLVSL